MSGRIVLRTHGGLGNQIFQILHAQCTVSKSDECNEMVVIHDANYYHKFEISSCFKKYEGGSKWNKFVSRLRIPKVLERLGLKKNGMIRVFGDTYLDGYFQDKQFFDKYDPRDFKKNIEELRTDLNIHGNLAQKPAVLHLRLGDFFRTKLEELQYAEKRIREMDGEIDVITNNQPVIEEICLLDKSLGSKIRLVNTKDYDAELVLKTFGQYKLINTNGSTLAFWAAVLCESDLRTEDTEQREIWRRCLNLLSS